VHEVSLVAELVTACEERSGGRPIEYVRVRHASSLPEDALRQAFSLLTADGLLANATLATEPFAVELRCPCGFVGVLAHDDVISSSLAVCPACGELRSRERTAEIELLEVRLA
jgi:Zn finger protein HypA/HybF involved in hydrogenase expression